jgi:hypothetical protein
MAVTPCQFLSKVTVAGDETVSDGDGFVSIRDAGILRNISQGQFDSSLGYTVVGW